MAFPPAPDAEIARWTLRLPPQLQALRLGLQQALAAHVPSDEADVTDLAERLVIAATELAGNALRHGRPPTVVTLLRSGGQLILDVADQDVRTWPTIAAHRPAADGGLGLQVAARLAQNVGWYAADTQKHVWATFAV